MYADGHPVLGLWRCFPRGTEKCICHVGVSHEVETHTCLGRLRDNLGSKEERELGENRKVRSFGSASTHFMGVWSPRNRELALPCRYGHKKWRQVHLGHNRIK